MHILLVEDDEKTADFLIQGIQDIGYSLDHACDGRRALDLVMDKKYDILIVDRMLPALDGLTLVRMIRDSGLNMPVLFLSALGDVDDRIKGLQVGGDDYLVKPFDLSELIARIEALMRRVSAQDTATALVVGDLKLDILSRKVLREGKRIYLHPREFKLLQYLMEHSGQVVTRTMLLENVWEYYFDPQTNVIDVHISRLRQKIDKPFEKAILTTIRGIGYKLHADL